MLIILKSDFLQLTGQFNINLNLMLQENGKNAILLLLPNSVQQPISLVKNYMKS